MTWRDSAVAVPTGSVLPDRGGGLWVGTAVGISRYGGPQLRTFDQRDGLGGDQVHAVLEDSQGRLWFRVGSRTYRYTDIRGGVTCCDRTRFADSTQAAGMATVLNRSMAEDRAGNLWFGPTRYDGQVFATFTPAEGLMLTPSAAALEHGGALLAAQLGGQQWRFDRGRFVGAAHSLQFANAGCRIVSTTGARPRMALTLRWTPTPWACARGRNTAAWLSDWGPATTSSYTQTVSPRRPTAMAMCSVLPAPWTPSVLPAAAGCRPTR